MLLRRALVSAALLTVALPATPATADYGHHHRPVDVPCSTVDLIQDIDTANSHGGGVLNLDDACNYTLTTVDNLDANGSANGLPQITSRIVVNGGASTTISRDSSAPDPFRLFDVAPLPES